MSSPHRSGGNSGQTKGGTRRVVGVKIVKTPGNVGEANLFVAIGRQQPVSIRSSTSMLGRRWNEAQVREHRRGVAQQEFSFDDDRRRGLLPSVCPRDSPAMDGRRRWMTPPC
jgi:hypothetical protein